MSKGRKPMKRDRYIIRIENQPVEVTEAVYRAYYGFERRERYIEEQNREHGVMLFCELGGARSGACCDIPDISTDIEHLAMSDLLMEALELVFDREEMFIIRGIYIDQTGLCEVARQMGLYHSSLQRRRDRLYPRLKKFLEEYYGFCGGSESPIGSINERNFSSSSEA